MIRIFKLPLAIVTLFVISQSCTTRRIKCVGEGSVVVQRHPEKQYQQTIKSTELNLKATVNILEKIKIADLDAGTKTKVTELREKLDQFSGRTQDVIKAAYDGIQSFPCDKEMRRRYFDVLDGISKENFALEKLRVGLLNITDKGKLDPTDEVRLKTLIGQYDSNNGEKAYNQNTPAPDKGVNIDSINAVFKKNQAKMDSLQRVVEKEKYKEPEQKVNIDSLASAIARQYQLKVDSIQNNFKASETQRSIDKNCESNNTGDYCFTNRKNIRITVRSTNARGVSGPIMTLEPGQTQCFYNLACESWDYYASDVTSNTALTFEASGQFLVEKCRSKTSDIK